MWYTLLLLASIFTATLAFAAEPAIPAVIERFVAANTQAQHHVWVLNAITPERQAVVLDFNVVLDGTTERRFLLLVSGTTIVGAQEVQLDGTLCTLESEDKHAI